MNKIDMGRYKWLIKNLSLFQMIKYLFIPKPLIKFESIKRHQIKPYKIKEGYLKRELATLLIKPSGLCKISLIINELKKRGVLIEKAVLIYDYAKYAKSIFNMVSDKEYDIWIHILEKDYYLYKNMAVILYLNESIEVVKHFKTRMRKKIGVSFYKIEESGKGYVVSVTPIHSSEQKELYREDVVINCMLKDGKAVILDVNILEDRINSINCNSNL